MQRENSIAVSHSDFLFETDGASLLLSNILPSHLVQVSHLSKPRFAPPTHTHNGARAVRAVFS